MTGTLKHQALSCNRTIQQYIIVIFKNLCVAKYETILIDLLITIGFILHFPFFSVIFIIEKSRLGNKDQQSEVHIGNERSLCRVTGDCFFHAVSYRAIGFSQTLHNTSCRFSCAIGN